MVCSRRITFETLEDRVVLSAEFALATAADPDALIASADRKIDVNWSLPSMQQLDDMIKFSSQVLSIEHMVDFGLGSVPGWHTKAEFNKPLKFSASVTGSLYVTPSNKLSSASLGLTVSFGAGAYIEGYWPLEIANAGVGVSINPSLSIGGSATYSCGHWYYSGKGSIGSSVKLYVEASAALWRGSLDVTAQLASSGEVDTSGNLTVKSGFTGTWGGQAYWRPWLGEDWIALFPRVSTEAWNVSVPDYHANLAPFFSQAVSKTLGGGAAAASSTVLVGAQSEDVDKLVVTTQPPWFLTAGDHFGLTVTANKPDGSVDTAFNGDVTISNALAWGNLLGTTTVTAANGIATFSNLSITVAAPYFNAYSLNVASEGLTGTKTDRFGVSAAEASYLTIVSPSTNLVTGKPFGLQVLAKDMYDNLVTSFYNNVTLTLSDYPTGATLGGTLTAAAKQGVATFSNLTLNTPSDGYLLHASYGSIGTDTDQSLSVSSQQLVVTTQPASKVKAGSALRVVAKIENGKGKVDTTFNGLVTISGEAFGLPLLGKTTVWAKKGVATFSGLVLNEASKGNYLTVSTAGIPTTLTKSFDVVATSARQLVVVPPPSKVTAAAPFDVAVAAKDAKGNVVTSFKGVVTIRLANNPSGAILGGKLTATAVNGVATFHGLTLDKTGSAFTLQTTARGLTTALSTAFDVTPAGTATHLVVTSQPPSQVAAGDDFGLTVSAEDGFGTVATGFSGSVTIGDPSGSGLQGTLTVTAMDGVATFTGLSRGQAGSDLTLPVNAAGLDPTTTDSFTVNPLSATQLDVWGPSSSVLPDSPFGMSVFAEDTYGNLDPNFGGQVTLAWANNPTGANLDGTLTATAAGGEAYFAGLTIDQLGLGYTLQAQTVALPIATSASFDVTDDQLAVTSQPPGLVPIGSDFSLTVAAKDAAGNVDASFNGDVTVTLIDCGGIGANLGGTHTVTAVNGVAVFSGFTLDQAGYYGLAVTADGVGTTASNVITVSSVQLPSISSIQPTSGPVTGGTLVTINGTNLGKATAVFFGNKAAKIKPNTNTATQIIVTSPAGLAGTVDVTVVTAGGMSSGWAADRFTYAPAPTARRGLDGIGLPASTSLDGGRIAPRAIDAVILALSDALSSVGKQDRREIDFFTNPAPWI